MLSKTAIVLAALAALAPAQQQKKGGGQPVQPAQQVKPGLYMIAGAGANSEVRVTNDGLIVVDDKLPGEKNYDDLMAQIKSISSQPIKYLIVTHHHADHTGNNDRFEAAGVKVIGHENLKKNAETYNQNPKPAPPDETYSGAEHTVKLAGVSVELHHFGRAHTSGDSVVYFPDLKTVVVSDVVTTGPTGPLADYAGGGSFAEWPKVLESILKLDFDTCIPGNGGPLTKADVEAYKTKIDTFVSRAKEAVAKGVPKDQLMSQIKTDDLGWMPRVPAVDAFYAELHK
ncbi:MAG TPA: MBL fold metallo-hydrolase [Bryobacteraceae bacterium]|jgi:glyoxylase-like metal-dependent hydrolase (beta-lactamase superfamily II)